MNDAVSQSFNSYFGVLKDPRINWKKLYPLTEILFVIIAGSVCFAESWSILGKKSRPIFRKIKSQNASFSCYNNTTVQPGTAMTVM